MVANSGTPWSLRYVPNPTTHRESSRSGMYLDIAVTHVRTETTFDAHLDTDEITSYCSVDVVASAYIRDVDDRVLDLAQTSARVTSASYATPAELEIAREACITAAVEDGVTRVLPSITR